MGRGPSFLDVLICGIAVYAGLFGMIHGPGAVEEAPKIETRPTQPVYYIPTEKIAHLDHVMNAFDRAGYSLIRPENYTHTWDIMWSFHNPFYNRESHVDLPSILQRLNSRQKVNHLPGASRFTSKVELAKESRRLALVPESFVLPGQYQEFIEYHESQPQGTTWVKKGTKHRGVQVVDPYDGALQDEESETLVQQFIRPYLIDGHSWDMGIYIAITSINPLRAYYYDNILLRFCQKAFEENLDRASRESYVIEDDYIPPWGMDSLRDYYVWGLNTFNVLRAYFANEGHDLDKLVKEALRGINDLLVHFEPHLDTRALQYPYGRTSFFSLYRVDLLVDRNFRPWIMEVNQSPNLSSAHTKDLAGMFHRISIDLLSLMGFMPGGINHPATSEKEIGFIVHSNEIDIAYDVCVKCTKDCQAAPNCLLCRRCRTPAQSKSLRSMVSEHRNRQGFLRLHPPSQALDPASITAKGNGTNNFLQREWIDLKCRHDYSWC